ncbi:DEAD/DEAH box helicase [Rhodobacter capsulatus]|nr:DEAD/DEAH box helicase [Rhodobacter capsulatus]
MRRRASDNAALYLQSLLAEGGLPDALLSRESGYQKAVLAAVEELERHGNADPETARLIADRTLNRLPEVFGHADSSLLLAELALAIVELRRALPPEIDEAAIETWLDRAVPGWADRFPIRLSEAARAAILRPALRRESTRSESNGPPLLRALRPRADGAGWLGIIKATGGVLPDALIPAAARGQILRLTSEQGLILRAHPEAGGWRLDPVGRNFTVMPLVEPAIFTANLDGRALCDVVLEAGLPEPEEILSFWVSGEEGGLKPAAQPRTRSDRIWVLAPEGVTGEPDAGVTILGAASAPGGRLWELSGVGEIRFGPHRTSIATGAETDAQSLQILPFGEIFRGWRALGRLPVYQGRMRYLGADLGLPLRDLQGQIRETPMRRVLGGRIVQWHLGGDLCAALRCVVLPADLQIDAGEIAPGVVEARAKGLPVGWRMSLAAAGVQTPFGTEARLDVGARDPGDIVLTLHDTASGLSLDLVRAWPARAPLLISPEGERLRSNRVLALRSIHGWRGVLPEQGAAVQLRIAKAAHAIGFAEAGQIRLASYGALLGQALAMTGADGKVNLRLVAGVETNRLEIGRYDWELPRGDAPDLGAEPCRLTALTVAPPHELRVKEVEGPLDLSGWLSDVSGIWFVQGQSARGVMRPFPWSSDPLPRSTREARIETYLAQIQGLMRRPTDPGWGEIEALTGSGKTECFLIPLLNDILKRVRVGAGVQAILLYPLNALIESQRERLSDWAEGLDGRVKFALYNGDTPETAFKAGHPSTRVELKNRKDIRDNPPDILVTNITMLEYLLLRAQDRAILEASQGALRWIVLDEAHSYVGSQAAEMALLLRRVRAAFGVAPEDVRLMATSATIGGEENALEKLTDFTAALAGVGRDRVAVIEGVEEDPQLPMPGPDGPLDPAALAAMTPSELWSALSPHPRIQALHRELKADPCSLTQIAGVLFADQGRTEAAQQVLDAVARAEGNGRALLAWRAHLFHRAQGGVYACVDPACPHRDAELIAPESGWSFGAVYTAPRPLCRCGAPVFEVVACGGCGAVHLQARLISGAQARLETPDPVEGDDFALDAEPEEDVAEGAASMVLLAGPQGKGRRVHLEKTTGLIFDNAPPEGTTSWPVALVEEPATRACCDQADEARLQEMRFGPAFFMGNALPQALEDLAAPEDRPGLPSGGRRAISFSDSRQGVARLAAKLQQEAERSLTRAFLYHAVQEGGAAADPHQLAELDAKIAKLKAVDAEMFAREIADAEGKRAEMTGDAGAVVRWADLVARFAAHPELRNFAGEVWRRRKLGGRMGDNPADLAQMFLLRELFRRPKVQNNPETMGLVQLVFPELDAAALNDPVPGALARAGVDAAGWLGLARAAIDFVFRDALASRIPDWMVPIVSPRFGKLNMIAAPELRFEDRPNNTRSWPGPVWKSRPMRLQSMVYDLIAGDPANPQHQDLAGEVLEKLWNLLKRTVLVSAAPGAYQLDFAKAAVTRLDAAWLCPVTRRPFGYSVAGRSPFDCKRKMDKVIFPRLPVARAVGVTTDERRALSHWCETDPEVAELRRRGLWSDMTDRVAAYPAFLRAQEHSAQIKRIELKDYEDRFNAGEINLLNCSTTMEMGVDLAAVPLVVNANVPPALSNYRQRVGRAGRRREPWAFGLTFCRDLPLDRQAFLNPAAFLTRKIAAPKVWFDSAPLVQRHVNAALIGRWLAEDGGMKIKANTGSFLGLPGSIENATPTEAPVDQFLRALAGEWGRGAALAASLRDLVRGTALEAVTPATLVAQTSAAMERLTVSWRQEYAALLDRSLGADEDTAKAFEFRARRMAGEFLLGDLARRGFTPAYGFATDVVSFDPLVSGRSDVDTEISFNARGGASRELHQAIREYAPGSEVVIDGLVYQSEGVRPAWGGEQDSSKLEDFQEMWDCGNCHAFGVSALGRPDTCPDCGSIVSDLRRILRPAGFLTAKPPHTGYESLAFSPFVAPRVSAQGGDWVALPDPAAGRYRYDPAGLVVTRASGRLGGGFAICLECGRAAPMEEGVQGVAAPVPESMVRHYPLARGRATKLTSDGHCPGGYTLPNRLQKHVHLAQTSHTDVFELQLPPPATEAQALALAAALREVLCARLGVEIPEIGLTSGPSVGADATRQVSAWLIDRAAGGAGLVARLQEVDLFSSVLAEAAQRLACPEECAHGCPSCILQPDLSLRDIRLDRRGARRLAEALVLRLQIPEALRVFGPQTRSLGGALVPAIDRLRRGGTLAKVVLCLHGMPDTWDFQGWPMRASLAMLASAGIAVELRLPSGALTHAGFDLSIKLALHRIAQHARISAVENAPHVGGLPVVSMLADAAGGWRGVAVHAAEEAQTNECWAMGGQGTVLIGPMEPPALLSSLSIEKLFEFGTGNGRVLTPEGDLDGPVAGFGRRFWGWIGKTALLEVGAMKAVGVTEVSYSDRYLLTPITLCLLAETIKATPGLGGAAVHIDLAPNGERRGLRDPSKIFEGYDDDRARQQTLAALLPKAKLRMAAQKNDLPHRRELAFTLSDGRRYRLLFDQGFGGMRAEGRDLRHDFRAPPELQAAKLHQIDLNVHAGDEPVILETRP